MTAGTGGDIERDLVGAVDVGATKTLVTVRLLPLDDWRARRLSSTLRAKGTTGGASLETTRRFPTERDPALELDRIAVELASLAVASRGVIRTVACAAPGPIDGARGVVLHSPNLGWRSQPITEPLASQLGVPVTLDDDARLGALGEATLGAGRRRQTVAYVTVSSGVGAGLVLDGRIWRGAHDLAGEIGHLTVDPNGPRCGCGRKGCVEAYVGGRSLARRAREAWPRARLADGCRAPRDASSVFVLARSGDPLARSLIDDAVEALGRGLAALAAVLDPDVIIVGGSVALAQRAFVRRAIAIARRRCIAEMGRTLVVVFADLGDESVLAGAAVAGAASARRS